MTEVSGMVAAGPEEPLPISQRLEAVTSWDHPPASSDDEGAFGVSLDPDLEVQSQLVALLFCSSDIA